MVLDLVGRLRVLAPEHHLSHVTAVVDLEGHALAALALPDEPRMREPEDGRRILLAEGFQGVQVSEQVESRLGERQFGIEPDGIRWPRPTGFAHVTVQGLAQRRKGLAAGRTASRLGVTAEADEMGLRRVQGFVEVKAFRAAPRALPDAVPVIREEQDRHAVPLLDPSGHDARDAVMIAFVGEEHEGLRVEIQLPLDLREDRRLEFRVQLAAIGVDRIEPLGEGTGLGRIIGGKQLKADLRGLQTASRVQARPELEADVLGPEVLPGGAGDVAQRSDARQDLAATHPLDAGPDQGAIGTVERHHVGDRADGDQIQEVLHARVEAAFQGQREHVGHPHPREILEVRELHLGVHDRVGIGQGLGHLVVIGHDQVDPVLLGLLGGGMG
ncbi:hypothetical protein D3C86_1250360 [compost metagenome]